MSLNTPYSASTKELHQAKLKTLLAALKPITAALALLLLVLALLHPKVLPAPHGPVQAVVTAIVAAILACIWWRLRSDKVLIRHAERYLLAGLTLLTIDNSLHFYWSGQAIQTTNFSLILFGFSLMAITPTVFIAGVCLVYGAWAIGVMVVPEPAVGWLHFHILQAITMAMSIAFYIGRIQILDSWQTAQLNLEARTQQLESALEELQKTNEIKRSRDQLVEEIKRRVDIEEQLRHAKDEAEDANRLKDAILATTSHEIRTPMTAILGFAELLSRQLVDTPQAKHANLIYRSGERLMELLNNIIDFARLEGNEMPIECQPCRAHDLVEQAVSFWGIVAEQKGIEIMGEAPDDVYVYCDPRRVDQVFNNLIGNAIRFTAQGGIELHARQEDARVVFTVEDTGTGMSPDFIPHAFKAFRQDINNSREYSGSGLGLALCQRLIEQMNGDISLKSEPNRGTKVVFSLPQCDPAVRMPTSDVALPENVVLTQTSDSRPTVLVLEDDLHCLRLVREILADSYEVIEAETAEQAIQAAKMQQPTICIFDIHLKESPKDGIEALRVVRANTDTQIPAIALTAFAAREDRDTILAGGFQHYMSKPFEPKDLETVVHRLITSHPS